MGLVLVQPRKASLDITEKKLTGTYRIKSNKLFGMEVGAVLEFVRWCVWYESRKAGFDTFKDVWGCFMVLITLMFWTFFLSIAVDDPLLFCSICNLKFASMMEIDEFGNFCCLTGDISILFSHVYLVVMYVYLNLIGCKCDVKDKLPIFEMSLLRNHQRGKNWNVVYTFGGMSRFLATVHPLPGWQLKDFIDVY